MSFLVKMYRKACATSPIETILIVVDDDHNMIMAMPLKPAPQIRRYQHLQNENPLSSCKAVLFFYFVDD